MLLLGGCVDLTGTDVNLPPPLDALGAAMTGTETLTLPTRGDILTARARRPPVHAELRPWAAAWALFQLFPL
jgi:hypothetical protein